MNKEKILECQNKLITEMAASVWANTKAEENIAVLSYINGVHEFANMLMDTIAMEPDQRELKTTITTVTNSMDGLSATQNKPKSGNKKESHEDKETDGESDGGGSAGTEKIEEPPETEPDSCNIAEKISVWRAEYNLTQKQAAEILKIYPSDMSKIEKGQAVPGPKVTERIISNIDRHRKSNYGEPCEHKDCVYRDKAGAIEYCNYIGIHNRKRPCSTENCSVYKPK